MIIYRTGVYGSFCGSPTGYSDIMNTSQMQLNALYIKNTLTAQGWSLTAIAGMLGNMQAESTINPGRWQNDSPGNTSLGYGLVQWTPSTKYTDWCREQGLTDPSHIDSSLARILYEVDNSIQWISTSTYNFSFKTFSTSTESVSTLAKAFLLCYERPADQSESVQNYRASLALEWYKYLTGGEAPPDIPDTPGTITRKKKKSNYFLLFNQRKRRQQWIKKPF
jgi:hypothetical protein